MYYDKETGIVKPWSDLKSSINQKSGKGMIHMERSKDLEEYIREYRADRRKTKKNI